VSDQSSLLNFFSLPVTTPYKSQNLSQFPLARLQIHHNNICRPSIFYLYSFRRCFLIRRFSILSFCAITIALALAGCSKSADSTANADAATDSSASGSVGSGGSGSKTKSAMKAKETHKQVVVPEDTAIPVTLDQTLSSKTASAGQPFLATVETAIEIDGKVVIPKGTRASGVVKDAKAAGRFKGGSSLELSLTNVTIEGTSYDISTAAPSFTHAGKGKRTAVAVGGGAGVGALIGGIAGGGKGAAIGAAVGAGAGTAGAAFTGKADVVLPAETALSFKLTQPLEVRLKHSQN
jgi:hypothetical protein